MIRGFQWDLGRQVERLDWLLTQLPRYAEWGYNELYLHLEDAVEYPSLPGVARHDAYSYRELGRLVKAAERVGIGVVPIINLLGHTQYLIKVPALRELNERVAVDGSPLETGQICPVHPRTLEVAKQLLEDVRPFCTAGKVHVGLDESFSLGQHPRSRAEIERIGLAAHFATYVGNLQELTRSLGLRMGMWADMLYFIPAAIPLLPRDVAQYEWYYYQFASRPRIELFNFRETDLGEKLRARGFEYWGCPMNGAFRFEPLPHFADRLENVVAWWRRCHRLGAAGFLVTSWEPYRLAIELTTVIDAATASLWLDRDGDDPRSMLERGFARVFGRSGAKRAAQIALACDRYPFAGYPRWEINGRWDVVSRRESIAPYRREERHFRKLRQSATGASIPKPLQASLDLRWYFAARDVCVREAQHGHFSATKFRSAVAIGKKAARQMWTRTRDRKIAGPNEEILRQDAVRAQAIRRSSDLLGPKWQLCYRVRNFAPAVQWVGIEQRSSDGRWKLCQGCHTIEFQAAAAQSRGGFTREHAAPIEWDGDQRRLPELRFVLRGVGQVEISNVELTNGSTWITGKIRRVIGLRAPRRGLPDVTATQVAKIRFERTKARS